MYFYEGMKVKVKDEIDQVYFSEYSGKRCTLNGRIGTIACAAPGGHFVSVRFPGMRNPHNNSDSFVFKTDALISLDSKVDYAGFIKNLGYYTESKQCFTEHPAIERVIYNDPATIIFWDDGTKTIVKCGEDDEFDPEKGLAMAISKKAFGNRGNYYDEFRKWLPKGESAIETVIKYMDAIPIPEDILRYVIKEIKDVMPIPEDILRQVIKEVKAKSGDSTEDAVKHE